jgi:hypothetical protein
MYGVTQSYVTSCAIYRSSVIHNTVLIFVLYISQNRRSPTLTLPPPSSVVSFKSHFGHLPVRDYWSPRISAYLCWNTRDAINLFLSTMAVRFGTSLSSTKHHRNVYVIVLWWSRKWTSWFNFLHLYGTSFANSISWFIDSFSELFPKLCLKYILFIVLHYRMGQMKNAYKVVIENLRSG